MRALSWCILLAGIGPACATSTVNLDEDSGPIEMDAAACTSMCSGMCVNLKTDGNNCGKCGTVCPMGASCVQGSCQCGSGLVRCGSACVDVKADNTNCGKCGTVCGADAGAIMGGGTWGCVNGSCSIICPMGKTECGGACIDTKTDIDNCGKCGNACDPQKEQCTDGMCCPTGQKVCNGMCTDPSSDPNNCGMCGMKCPMNMPSCVGGKCTTLYTFQGVQTNLPISMLAGWKQCYTDTYNVSMNVANVAANCQGTYLLLGCMPNGNQNLTVAAMGLKSDVTFVTGNSGCGQNKTHAANGVEWYYDTNWSWGFLKAGDTKSLCSCDTDGTDAALRLCWHANSGGYRCGATTGLNSNSSWTRVVYVAQ